MSLGNTINSHTVERVLLIDDDKFSLQVMKMTLEKAGLSVVTSSDPIAALEILKSNPKSHFACIITDYQMPGIDGIEVVREAKEFDSCLGTIMITAIEEQEIVKESYRSGALDFLTKPVNPRDLVKIARDTVKLTFQTRKETETVAGVEEAGREGSGISAPLPQSLKDNLEIVFRPRHAVGGDFIMGYEKNDYQFGLLLGDVSGHTIKSALLSSYFQGFIQGQTSSDSNFLHTLAKFNQLLFENNESSEGNRSSLSLCHLAINKDARAVEMTNCGFSAPIAVDLQGNVSDWPEGTFAIGWFDDIDLCAEEKITHSLGYFYAATDGLEDHANDIGVNAWSLFHFLTTKKEDTKSTERILANSRDDILAVRYSLKTADDIPSGGLPEVIFHNTYAGAAYKEVDQIQKNFVESMTLALSSKFESRKHDILLCMREGIINALKHGCQGSNSHRATLTAFYKDEENTLGIIISDPGDGHSFSVSDRKADLETDMPGAKHLGLVMINELPDETQSDRNGSYVRMLFKLKDESSQSMSQFLPPSFFGKIESLSTS